MWKTYRRIGTTEMRPYVPGEDLTGISVPATETPHAGGMIARNPQDPADQWYVTETYVTGHMEEVPETIERPAPLHFPEEYQQ